MKKQEIKKHNGTIIIKALGIAASFAYFLMLGVIFFLATAVLVVIFGRDSPGTALFFSTLMFPLYFTVMYYFVEGIKAVLNDLTIKQNGNH